MSLITKWLDKISKEKNAHKHQEKKIVLNGNNILWRGNMAKHIEQNRHWVYVAVRAIAGRIAGTPLNFYYADSKEMLDWNHPLTSMLREVNPFETNVGLWMRTITFLELTGNCYWYIARNKNNIPEEIWLLPPQHVRIIPDKEKFISGYCYENAENREIFLPEEIIHLKYPSPESCYYGSGPLSAAAESVESHMAMKVAERKAFENGAFPGLAITTDEKLSPEARERLQIQFNSGFAGSNKAGKAIILEQGLKIRPFTFSPREMDFLESSKTTRNEILAVFGVPAAVAGICEDVNRASAEAMLWTFAENTIMPKLKLIAAQLTQDLCPLFGEPIIANFESPIPNSKVEEREDMIARLRYGVTTPQEERTKLGLKNL